MKKTIILVLGLLISFSGLCQDWNWPRDKQKAKGKWMYASDMLKAEKYQEAVKPLRWLLNEAPDLSESLYIKAAKIYRGLVDQADNQKQRIALQDTVLMMYDRRMKHFGDSANVLNRKGTWAGYYLSNREESLDRLYGLFKKIMAMNGNSTYAYNIRIFIDVACDYKRKGAIPEDTLFSDYSSIGSIIRYNLKNSSRQSEWEKARKELREHMANCLNNPCAFYNREYGPRFASTPDTSLAKSIFSMTSAAGCYDSLYQAAGDYLLENTNDPEIAFALAESYENKEKTDKSIHYWKKAAETANKAEQKGKAYFKIAKAYSNQGQKVKARSFARKALNTGTYQTEAYNLIGNLYYSSYEQCKVDNVVKSRAVFIAAHKMYEKAGNTSMMKECEGQFPSMAEIHTYGEKLGGTINTGCWINESVTIQKR